MGNLFKFFWEQNFNETIILFLPVQQSCKRLKYYREKKFNPLYFSIKNLQYSMRSLGKIKLLEKFCSSNKVVRVVHNKNML